MKFKLSASESDLGKPYDTRLMKRLLKYAKPYLPLLLLTFVLVIAVTASQLARPYVIKIAIDDYINGTHLPMTIIDEDSSTNIINNNLEIAGIMFERNYSISEELASEQIKLADVYQIVKVENEYYLINGYIPEHNHIKTIDIEPLNPNINNSNTHVSLQNYYNFDYNFLIRGFPAFQLTDSQISEMRGQLINALITISLIFLLIIIVSFILAYIKTYLLHYVGQKIVYDIREHAFNHLQKMSISYFDSQPVGRLVTRITNDTENLNEMYTNVIVNLFKDILLIIGIMAILLYLDVRLALISFITLPIMLLITAIYRKHARNAFRELRVQLARINSNIQESLSGIRVIQAFGLQVKKFREFKAINTEHFKANYKELIVFALFRPSMDLVYGLTIAIIIWYGGSSIIQGTIQFGLLYAFVQYTEQFFRPIRDLAEKYNIMQSAMASAERLFQLIDEPITIEKNNNTTEKPATITKGKIQFKDVSFSYDGQSNVLKNISFIVKPGETIAIVGATGSGKTTILNLLTRFYDIDSGQILVDDQNINSYDVFQLRKAIGVVQQDVFLFTGNIINNIRLDNNNVSDEDVIQAAKYVNADKFIQRLPDKYYEQVTERASTLSTGQRQLLAFARTLVQKPKILLLDEATANIDSWTEQLIQDALPRLAKKRTTLIVAHRLSTIQNADRILVIHKGCLVEQGTHTQLLEKKGYYHALYHMQYAE